MTAPAPFSGGQPYFIEIQPFLCPRNNGISYPASVIKLIRHMKAKYNFWFFSVDFKNSGKSTSEIFGKCQALMCNKNSRGIVNVETPSKHAKEYYKLLQITIPPYVELSKYTGLIMNPKV
jgi:hypothetical protein